MTPGMRGDATAMCELLGRQLSGCGVPHPIAGAVALAARGHLGLDQHDFADLIGLGISDLAKAESGMTPFGRLPRELDWILEDIKGLDLLALAATARAERCGNSASSCQHEQPCSDA